ncbi:hypothetical protein [Nocardia seriolae]|uniref:Uncharacterized protein n=2 Tax=Nocardia seriolae TaxID=37332 RepID=A0ABC8B5S7_9NOCA|nr:hypothetical protein [Nocardia seriolae]APB01723.1 hypothetical protein NS506_07704 [Nocardia seriolae]MTJ60816.1 hypothetical protein [Nocardia seriolae]MTJ76539.1 hypothetical protein [Nocardia seriolae]MTK35003.1 hypothetical protein [Nocardia seriolae]MTK45006.1 hypothetical protein [Nocardia seriolae]
MPQTHRPEYSGGRLTTYFGSRHTIEEFQRPLRRLNGDDRYSLNLAALPTPAWPDELTEADEAAMGLQYLQCAGAADALSVEIHMGVDGVSRLFTLGRPGDYDGDPEVIIPFQRGNHAPRAYPAEVFTADEAAQIFFTYYKTGSLDGDYHLREVGLDAFDKSHEASR